MRKRTTLCTVALLARLASGIVSGTADGVTVDAFTERSTAMLEVAYDVWEVPERTRQELERLLEALE